MTQSKPPFVRPLAGMVAYLPITEERVESVIDTVTAGGLAMDVRKSAGGIDLPDIADNTEIEGYVVGVGDEVAEPISERLALALATHVIGPREYPGTLKAEIIVALAQEFQHIAATLKAPMDLVIGDKILVEQWHATTIQLGDCEFNLVPIEAVVGIVD